MLQPRSILCFSLLGILLTSFPRPCLIASASTPMVHHVLFKLRALFSTRYPGLVFLALVLTPFSFSSSYSLTQHSHHIHQFFPSPLRHMSHRHLRREFKIFVILPSLVNFSFWNEFHSYPKWVLTYLRLSQAYHIVLLDIFYSSTTTGQTAWFF